MGHKTEEPTTLGGFFWTAIFLEAERAGFEPAKVLPLLAFQASALDHYATSPDEENAWLRP